MGRGWRQNCPVDERVSGPVVDLEKSFDGLADAYDEVRPGYPEAVFDRIVEYGGLDASSSLLEVGTGTGKATVSLARRGFRILGLEPAPNMARVARLQLAEFPHVTIEATTFEDWRPRPVAFNLAFSAQAFHWLSPDGRLAKFARALRRPGYLAVVGNAAALPGGVVGKAIREVYELRAPALLERDHADIWYGSAESPIVDELRLSPLFGNIEAEFTTWQRTLDTRQYCALLATYSDHSTLPQEQLRELLAGIATVVDHHEGEVIVTYKTGLFLARAV